MRAPLLAGLCSLAFALPAGAEEEASKGYTLRVTSLPVLLERAGAREAVRAPGTQAMRLQERVGVGAGGEAVAEVGRTRFVVGENTTFWVYRVDGDRVVFVANRVRAIARVGAHVQLRTSAGELTVVSNLQPVRLYDAAGKVLRDVAAGGSVTVSREGNLAGRAPAPEVPPLEAPPLEPLPDEAPQPPQLRLVVMQGPLTIQRAGAGGPTERVEDAGEVALAESDLVSLGAGARAELSVGGATVMLHPFVTFSVRASAPQAVVTLLGIDLELAPGTVLEARRGSLQLTVTSGSVLVTGAASGGTTLSITMPDGSTAELVLPEGGGPVQIAVSADGGVVFENQGSTPISVGGVAVGAGESATATAAGISVAPTETSDDGSGGDDGPGGDDGSGGDDGPGGDDGSGGGDGSGAGGGSPPSPLEQTTTQSGDPPPSTRDAPPASPPPPSPGL